MPTNVLGGAVILSGDDRGERAGGLGLRLHPNKDSEDRRLASGDTGGEHEIGAGDAVCTGNLNSVRPYLPLPVLPLFSVFRGHKFRCGPLGELVFLWSSPAADLWPLQVAARTGNILKKHVGTPKAYLRKQSFSARISRYTPALFTESGRFISKVFHPSHQKDYAYLLKS